MKVRIDNFFVKETFCSKRSSTLKQNSLEDEDDSVHYVDVGKHLTIAQEPNFLSAERSKLKKDLKSTEDKILEEMNRGAFKALPLNRQLFEPRVSPSKNQQVKPEITKIEAFNLSVTNAKKQASEAITDENQNQFKALALNKNIFMPKATERYSAPPKMHITQPKGFNLSTERRAKLPRKQLEIQDN